MSRSIRELLKESPGFRLGVVASVVGGVALGEFFGAGLGWTNNWAEQLGLDSTIVIVGIVATDVAVEGLIEGDNDSNNK